MFCSNCGKAVAEQAIMCPGCGARPFASTAFCWNCGASASPNAEVCVKCGGTLKKGAEVAGNVSSKSRLAFVLLSFFLGGFGVHRFYAGTIGTGVIMLIMGIVGAATAWIMVGLFQLIPVGMWALIDFVFGIAGRFRDGKGAVLKNW
ncbi:MAG: TM2 domain-containing protein [Chloroflexi bacterium]|nr:TM2 domain-containing protein [Chloroflexota bacterium]